MDRKQETFRDKMREKTRQRIILAAMTLFTERRYEDVTTRDIAQAAGVSTGAIFVTFNGKSDLWEACAGNLKMPTPGEWAAAIGCLEDAMGDLNPGSGWNADAARMLIERAVRR